MRRRYPGNRFTVDAGDLFERIRFKRLIRLSLERLGRFKDTLKNSVNMFRVIPKIEKVLKSHN